MNSSLTLFDDFERTETRSAYNNESHFEYSNLSARPAFFAIRQMLEEWFARYPDYKSGGRKDLRNRFRDRNRQNHVGAFFELFLHEYLIRLGYTVIPHPEIPGVSTHPEFLVRREGQDCFYLEATVPEPRQINHKDSTRLNQLHDALQKVQSPDYFLDVTHSGYPKAVVSVKPLIRKIEAWLRSLDYSEIQRVWRERGFFGPPEFHDNIAGMYLSIRPVPKSEKSRGKGGIRPVGFFGPAEAQAVDTVSAIREGVRAKRKIYGQLNLPYVIAVNILEQFVHIHSTVDALFGREAVRHIGYTDGTDKTEYVRNPDGIWISERGPINEGISAVLVFLQMWVWNMSTIQSALIYNPFASKPLIDELPFRRIVGDRASGKFSEIAEKKSIAEVLRLPTPWPVPDIEVLD